MLAIETNPEIRMLNDSINLMRNLNNWTNDISFWKTIPYIEIPPLSLRNPQTTFPIYVTDHVTITAHCIRGYYICRSHKIIIQKHLFSLCNNSCHLC